MDISIIIPTYNRKDRLRQCLRSIIEQDYPQDKFEIIVVDDGSNDGTQDLLKDLSEKHHNLRYFSQTHRGPAAARNIGIKKAEAEIIGFTDNDCILKNDWIKQMLSVHKLEEDVMVIGGLTKVDNRNIRALVSQFLSDGAIETNIDGTIRTIFFPTCNVSFKKKYLDEEFNELFLLPAGEDLEFFWRLYKKGSKLDYKQNIEIFHNCNSSFKSFLKQAYMYGRGNYLVQHIHRDHPLLKEIKTENNISFIFGLIINFIKIPRFSYLLGSRLIHKHNCLSFYDKFRTCFYFALHKIVYLIGNIAEHKRVNRIVKQQLKDIAKGNNAILPKPQFIILDITHRCNIKCNICEIRKDGQAEELVADEVKGLISQAIEWGVKEFVLSGGEPLIRDDIFEILDFVKEKKYHIGVLTNGILLTGEFINKLLPYLISDALSLSISLDALTPSIHNDIRGADGCFEKTINGLKILSHLKKNYPNINFNVISIILNENLEELLPLADFLKSLDVNSIQFQPLLANNLIMKERSTRAKYWIHPERLHILDQIIDDLVEFKRRNYQLVQNSESNLRLVKKYFRGFLKPSDINCLYATKTMLIANNGDVTTCFDCYGNIREKALQNIYISKRAEQARKRIRDCKSPCLLPCFCN